MLRKRIVEFVNDGDFGLASGNKRDDEYERVWFKEPVGGDEVAFESGVFLLSKARAERLKTTDEGMVPGQPDDQPTPTTTVGPSPAPDPGDPPVVPIVGPGPKATLRLKGTVPPEVWNRLGTRILPKLRSGEGLSVGVEFSVSVDAGLAQNVQLELRQALTDLGLQDQVSVDTT